MRLGRLVKTRDLHLLPAFQGRLVRDNSRRCVGQRFVYVHHRLASFHKGIDKLEIALARGKKTYDKREDIKRRDLEREDGRDYKIR